MRMFPKNERVEESSHFALKLVGRLIFSLYRDSCMLVKLLVHYCVPAVGYHWYFSFPVLGS